MAENAGGAALESNSPTLESVMGEWYSDFGSTAEPEPDAGAPPAEVSETPSSEGADPSATPESAAPDASTPDAPDAQAPTTTDLDPLEGATPFGYTVNGEQRQFDGITVLKDGGAIVDPEAMDRMVRVFTERDHLYEQGQQRYQASQDLEKRLAWTPPGSDTPLTGIAAAEALHHDRARLLTIEHALNTLFEKPEHLARLLIGNEDGSVAFNPLAVENFKLSLDRRQTQIRSRVADLFSKMASPPAPSASFEPSAFATKAVDAANVQGLTDADRKTLEAIAPKFIRLATIEDRNVNPALVVGQPFVEQAFLDMVKERAEMRASTAKTVTTATLAATANRARTAAAAVGTKPSAPARPAPRPTSQPDDAPNDFDDAFTRAEKAAAGALRAHAMGAR